MPVVTEDTVAYLLRCVNKFDKFFKVYKCIISEASLVRAWFEIKNRSWTLGKRRLNKYHCHHKIENLTLNWFQKVNQKLNVYKYHYKFMRALTVLKKKNEKCRFFLFHLDDQIVQRAMYKILSIIFEGYFFWEKIEKEIVYANYCETIHDQQIVKKKGCKEYWVRWAQIKPVFLSLWSTFRLKKDVYSVVRVIRAWSLNWVASYDFSKLFYSLDSNLFVQKLWKYIKDKQLMILIKKLLKTQIVHITVVVQNGILRIPQGNLLLLLLFNFYIHSFDEFVEKNVKSVARAENRKWKFWFDLEKSFCLNKIKPPLFKAKSFFTKKDTKFDKGVVLEQNYWEKKFTAVCCIRYNYDFLIGFFMNKVQSGWIIKNINQYLKNKLKFDNTNKLIKYIFNDKLKFLGFEIRLTSITKLKHFKNKQLEIYKRHRSSVFRKRAYDYTQFLKVVEWMGREAVIGTVMNSTLFQKNIFADRRLQKRVVFLAPQEYWFYYKHKLNKKIDLAFKLRYKDSYLRLNRWVNSKQSLLNLSKNAECVKVSKKNHDDRFERIRQKLIKLKYEGGYPLRLKLKLIKKNSIKLNYSSELVSTLQIFFPKKQVIAEFKRKSVLNSQGMPCSSRLKVMLSDIAIIRWYSKIGRRLISYYGCIYTSNDFKYQVSWILRYSLFRTIGVKYNKSMSWVIDQFGFDPKVISKNQLIVSFPSLEWIHFRRKKYMTQTWGKQNSDAIPHYNLLCLNQTGVLLNNLKYQSFFR